MLRERLPDRIVGTIGQSGLIGPAELAFYRGATGLASDIDGGAVDRIDHFGDTNRTEESLDPVLLLLVLVVLVALLTPVAVFIAAAVRFGGERRDRRLAALRLVGSDSRMTRRIAAGEALVVAVLGLVFGTAFFLADRQFANSVKVFDVSVFPEYLAPSPMLALLICVAVPLAAVLVTQFAMRSAVIEPLGVVRTAKPSRRRLWWRLTLPLAGLALLAPMIGQGADGGNFNQYLVIGGTLCVLVGVTALLPWAVEAVVVRLGAGPVPWQLAVRRLQLGSGTAARTVNGIAVAVAGAIALQMLFTGVDGEYTRQTAPDLSQTEMIGDVPPGQSLGAARERFERIRGVEVTATLSSAFLADRRTEARNAAEVTIADCASLREIAKLPSCRDGDAFRLPSSTFEDAPGLVKAGRTLWFQDMAEPPSWTVPGDLKRAEPVPDSHGYEREGFLLTPGAVPARAAAATTGHLSLRIDESVPDVREHARTKAAAIYPYREPREWAPAELNHRYASIRTGLFIGALCVLILIGASLLVSQLEQLRDRRKLLSSLVAFGTRRDTLALSVLWQTAVPVGLGLLLASVVGLTLGAVLMRMAAAPVQVDWRSVLSMTGAGVGVVLAVTLLSLPPLLRLMRSDGLRTE
ncbi:membrane protein [Streptomyces olivaceoviridis]|nr:membrane protein [Streptomyces olivaceoviridis]